MVILLLRLIGQELTVVFFVKAAESHGEIVVGFQEILFHDIPKQAWLFHILIRFT
jgi:hypothetical protein